MYININIIALLHNSDWSDWDASVSVSLTISDFKGQVQGWDWFLTRFVKACWEWWCRWNCDLRVIKYKCTKKGIFCRTESIDMTPKSCAHICARHSGELLQNRQLKLRRWSWYLARETHKDTAVSVWAWQVGFWRVPEHRVSSRTDRIGNMD